jgi:thioredoxin 1
MKSLIKTPLRIAIGVAFVAALAGAVAVKQGRCADELNNKSQSVQAEAPARPPKLLDLGATKCIPCKMMAPVLEKLKKDYDGRLEVEFIDVWENPGAGKQHKIELIPTQIFYSNSGRELYRHVGFYGREDILAKWKELGVDLNRKTGSIDSVKPSAASGPGNTKRD